MVADDIDATDLGHRALFDVETHAHTVTLHRADYGLDGGAILALTQILALDFLFRLLQHGAVKNHSLGETDLLEPLLHLVAGKGLVAGEVNLGNRRTLLQRHHQHVAFGFQTHVLEKTGGVERLDGLRRTLIVHGLANFDRQVIEDSAGLRALNAFDTNVLDHERLHGHDRGSVESDDQGREMAKLHYFFRSACDESIDIVIESHEHKQSQQRQADFLPDGHSALRNGAPLQNFDDIIH